MLLTLGIGTAWAAEYALYSGTITEGDYVIVYDGNAMNNTVSSSRLGNTTVTITDDKISNPDATIVWHIAPSGDYWTIFSANANKYAASTGAKNKAQLLGSGTDEKSLWTVSGSGIYEFVNKANAAANVNKNLRQNGTYGFACYATSTGGALSLYKKVEQSGGGETPDPEPEPDPTPDPEPEPDPTPDPGTGGEETWTLVTDASDLKAGDQVVIAATESAFALGPQDTNNRTAVAITKTGNNITWTTDVQIITLEAGNKANTFAFHTGSAGYLYAASSSSNHLKTKTTLDDNGSWTISITSAGVATIKAQGTNTRNWIRKNSSSAIFSCYGSGQNDVAIYKKMTSSGGDEPETPATDLTDAQFAWSAATAEATMGASNTFPTLTNTLPVSVTYESSTPATATIAADGAITLVAPGTTTISAKFAGGEVSGTTYAPKTVTYALTVLKAPATPAENMYVKVTDAVTDGEYLIVYEDGNVAFNGALTTLDAVSNTVEVVINSNTIAGNTDIDAAK